MLSEFAIECPHCNLMILIEKLNCGIFRHGVIISTGQQIPPHAPKEECDHFVNNGLIHGCGKPFQILLIDNKVVIQICDYI